MFCKAPESNRDWLGDFYYYYELKKKWWSGDPVVGQMIESEWWGDKAITPVCSKVTTNSLQRHHEWSGSTGGILG